MGKPDTITRRPDLNKGETDNKNVTMLKPEHFRRLAHRASEIQTQLFTSIYERIWKAARQRDEVVVKEQASKNKDCVTTTPEQPYPTKRGCCEAQIIEHSKKRL